MDKDFDKFHEKEQVILKSNKLYTLDELSKFLITLSFQEMDDFFFLARVDKTQWQSINLTDIVVYEDNKQLDLCKEMPWNKLILDYLFATLPFECSTKFIDLVFNISEAFHLSVEHRNKIYDRANLEMAFYKYREDVRNELFGDPGSKDVRINILKTYPRTK